MCVQHNDNRTQDGRGLMAVEESESIWHMEVPNLSRALDTIDVGYSITVTSMPNNYMNLFWPSFVGVTLVVAVHLFALRFRFMWKKDGLWLPASAEVAIAYSLPSG